MNMDTAISVVNLFLENLPGALGLILFIYVGMRAGIIPSSKDINRINETLVKQTTAINILLAKEDLGTIGSQSPVRLSETGKKISRNINAEKIINSKLDGLRPAFESLSNSYDIR